MSYFSHLNYKSTDNSDENSKLLKKFDLKV